MTPKRKIHINKGTFECRDITARHTEIKIIIRKYYERFYDNMINNKIKWTNLKKNTFCDM